MRPAIYANALGKRFANGHEALKGVSFSIEHGEVVSLLGRNGAGKSVLLKILAGILQPSSGYAEVAGAVAPLLEIGTGFHPELSGLENIYLNGVLLGMTRDGVRRRLDAIVEFSGLEPFLSEPIRQYSSGMRMRLAFAVAAHLDRDIYFLDEVLAVGDRDFRDKCHRRIRQLAAQGRTIVFVSHGSEFQDLCKRALLLDRGSLIDSGPLHSVLQHYHSLSHPEAVR